MRVADFLNALERLAPAQLAQPDDNSGLLVGDRENSVERVLVALEATDEVVEEAAESGCDTILTHHPLLFSPVRSLVEERPRERLLRRIVERRMVLVACHTNLDAAPLGLATVAGEALGLRKMVPLQSAAAGWFKFVGFIPIDSVDTVAAAVFAAGAGGIGNYRECAFATEGTGWFTALPGSSPAVGEVSRPERTPEMRWETVVPRTRLASVIRAFVETHPYEEPSFDVYPVEDVIPGAGLGRVGILVEPLSVQALTEQAATAFELSTAVWSGDGKRLVSRVGVLPGSGRSLIEAASDRCEVFITGDVGYHAADQASGLGLSLIDVPHGEFEWWAFRRWSNALCREVAGTGVNLKISESWRSPWTVSILGDRDKVRVDGGHMRLWIDGGSRGNPGPSAIGVVIEDAEGRLLQTVSQVIGTGTNNVAEYRALLAGLTVAAKLAATTVEVLSDSELLVKQVRGEYKVKNDGLKPLHAEAVDLAGSFSCFTIRHIPREQNVRADGLVNQALDEQERAGL